MDIALLTPAKGSDSRPGSRNGASGQADSSSPFAAEYDKARTSAANATAPHAQASSGGKHQGEATQGEPASSPLPGASESAKLDQSAMPATAADASDTASTLSEAILATDDRHKAASDPEAHPDATPELALSPLARNIALANGDGLPGSQAPLSADAKSAWQKLQREAESRQDDADGQLISMTLPQALAEVRERMAAIQQAGQSLESATNAALPAAHHPGMPALQTLTTGQAAMPTTQATLSGPDANPTFDLAAAKLQAAAPQAGDATALDASLTKAGQTLLSGAEMEGTEQSGPSPHSILTTASAPGAQATASPANGTPSASSPPITAALNTPLASPEWGASLSQQLVRIQQRGDQRVELHLNPAELGPLSVSLKMGEQQAQLHFSSAHASVRAAVEGAIPQLREALADSGISLGEAMVSDQGQFAQNPFSQDQSGQQRGTGQSPMADAGLPGDGDTVAQGMAARDISALGAINLYA
ncbi:flagellar hook-length control protein FliK [Halomonas sp. WWR20]